MSRIRTRMPGCVAHPFFLGEGAAWQFYRDMGGPDGLFGKPAPTGSGYIVPLPVAIRDAQACHILGVYQTPPTPGSAAKAATLKPEDRVRIAARARRHAEKLRQAAR